MTRAMSGTAPILASLALSALLGGCTTVHVDRPVGDTAATLDPADWNGTWCDARWLASDAPSAGPEAADAECLVFTVADPTAGVLDVVSPSEPGESYRAHLRYAGKDRDAILVSVEDGPAFTFELRTRRDGALLLAWSVSGDGFAREVGAGRIAGRVDDRSVRLDPPSEAALARIAESGGDLYDWAHPVVLVRVGD